MGRNKIGQKWPEDGNALGWGRAYALCMELEKLCGPDFFRDVFRAMAENQIRFPESASDKERTDLLLDAMQTQTDQYIWAFFARAGFKP